MKKEAMRKGLIPYNRDRVLTSECEKCPYFRGYQEPQAQSSDEDTHERLPTLRVTKEMIEQAIQTAIEEETQWRLAEEESR